MKTLSLILLATCSTAPLLAQTSATPPTAAVVTPAMARKSADHPAMRPPASLMPPPPDRLNTAQRVAALNNRPPLKELPAFTVTDRDGHPVAAKTFSHSSHWLLIYRRQNCLPCDRLMNVLAAGDSNTLKSGQPYVILVAGKAPEALEKVRANFSTLSEAKWLADRDEQAFAALKPRGTPIIYAMDGNTIAWDVPGNLGNPATVEKMATAWITSGKTSSTNTAAATTSTSTATPPATK